MFIAYELKMPLHEVGAMSPDQLGYWLAFFQIKNEKAKASSKASRSGPKGRRNTAETND